MKAKEPEVSHRRCVLNPILIARLACFGHQNYRAQIRHQTPLIFNSEYIFLIVQHGFGSVCASRAKLGHGKLVAEWLVSPNPFEFEVFFGNARNIFEGS